MQLVDVTARDGLQALPYVVPTELKVELVNRLVAAGIRRLEVASFVSRTRVPQMADAEHLLSQLVHPDAVLIGLTLNERGARRALETAVHEINTVCIATEDLAVANQGRTSAETVDDAVGVIKLLVLERRTVHATIGAAFGATREQVDPTRIARIARRLADHGAAEIVLADTLGIATPAITDRLLSAVRKATPDLHLRLHLHDPNGQAIESAKVAVAHGVTSFDCSIAGLGGCPSTDRQSGNFSTEQAAGLALTHDPDFSPTPVAVRGVSEWFGGHLEALMQTHGLERAQFS